MGRKREKRKKIYRKRLRKTKKGKMKKSILPFLKEVFLDHMEYFFPILNTLCSGP